MKKKLIASLLSAVLVFGLVPLPAFAQNASDLVAGASAAGLSMRAAKKLSNATKKKMLSAYKKVLKKAKARKGIYVGLKTYNDTAQYAVYDMGGDGVPELFVVGDFSGLAGFVEVYGYASGKAKDLGRVYTADGWLYGTPGGELYCASGRQGSFYVQSVSESSGKLSVKSPYVSFSATSYDDWENALNRMNSWLANRGAKPLTSKSVTNYALLKSAIKVSKTTDISEAKVSVTASKKYTGKAVKPKVTVKLSGKKLKVGKNYTVTYRNSAGKKVSAPKAAGTYKVVVKGKGNLKGSVTKTFKVKSPSKKALDKKAKSVLKEAAKKLAKKSNRLNYRLIDLNGDGVSEMLVQRHEDEGMWGNFLVYACKSGKAKKLLDKRVYGDWSSFVVYRASKAFTAYGSGHGGESYSHFALSGGKCAEVAGRSRSNATGSWSAWSYYKPTSGQGSVYISKSEFDKLTAPLTQGKSTSIKGPFSWKKA